MAFKRIWTYSASSSFPLRPLATWVRYVSECALSCLVLNSLIGYWFGPGAPPPILLLGKHWFHVWRSKFRVCIVMIKIKRITTLDPQTNVLFYRLPILKIEYFSSEYLHTVSPLNSVPIPLIGWSCTSIISKRIKNFEIDFHLIRGLTVLK